MPTHMNTMTHAKLKPYNAVLKKIIRAAKQMDYEACFNKLTQNQENMGHYK